MENVREDALLNIKEVRENSVEKEQLEHFKKEVEDNFMVSSKEHVSHSKQMGNLLDRINLLEKRYQEQ